MIYTYQSLLREIEKLEQRIAIARAQNNLDRAHYLEGRKDGMSELLNSVPKEDEKIIKKAQP